MEISKPSANASIEARLDSISAQLAFLIERQKKTEELFTEAAPILKAVMKSATERLDIAEKKGYFDFGKELIQVGEKVVDSFSPEDVRLFGNAIVGILETVRAMTQPEVLKVASDASMVLQHADKAEPIGLFGMVKATTDHDVQKGMSVLVEVMKHVGRAAVVVREQREASPMASKKAKLNAITGAKKALGVERTAPPAVQRALEAKVVAAKAIDAKAGAPLSGPGCAVPSAGPSPVAATMDGVGFSADGHLANAADWTRALGEKLASMQGVAMSEAHWSLVELARADFAATKTSPNIRRLTQIANVSTKDVYALFPKAPARTLAKIAGLPKPAGCL